MNNSVGKRNQIPAPNISSGRPQAGRPAFRSARIPVRRFGTLQNLIASQTDFANLWAGVRTCSQVAKRKHSGASSEFRLFARAQRKKILRPLNRLLQAAQELLEVGIAFDEIDFRGVDHKQVRRGVAEEEMLVGADNFFEVVARDLLLRGRFFPGDALAQDFGRGLEVDHQIGRLQSRGEHFKVPLVKLQFLVVEIDVSEYLVLLEQKIGNQGRRVDPLRLQETLVPLDQKI